MTLPREVDAVVIWRGSQQADQMTTTDPTRSPNGTEFLWAYTHVPQRVLNDAGGELTGTWDIDEAERFADRMQARIEQVAPGFAPRIVTRRILTPIDLERSRAWSAALSTEELPLSTSS
jgi:phytoene dehydrogenase-like protein